MDILSLSSNGYLLAGAAFTADLHMYTVSGGYVRTLNVPRSTHVYNAVWTHSGNIVYTTADYMLLMSITGDVLNNNSVSAARGFSSVSQDGDIYISNRGNVLVSTDDGMTWTTKFSAPDNICYIHQAIKASSDQ
jgi:photosystem II stability/assembly factor-like uncharacterized protein